MINREQVVFVMCDDADCNGEMLLRTSGARRRPKERRNVFETARRPKKTMNGTFNFMIFKEERRRGLKNALRRPEVLRSKIPEAKLKKSGSDVSGVFQFMT